MFLNCRSLGSGTQHLLNFIWKSVPGHLIWAPASWVQPFLWAWSQWATIPCNFKPADLGISVTCSQKHLLYFINRSISCWKWKWVVLFLGQGIYTPKETWRKGNTIEHLLYVRHKCKVFLQTFSILKVASLYLFTCCCHSEWCGRCWSWGPRFPWLLERLVVAVSGLSMDLYSCCGHMEVCCFRVSVWQELISLLPW